MNNAAYLAPLTPVVLRAFLWLIPVAVVLGIMKSPAGKGFIGEVLVKLAAKFALPSRVYHPMHNVTLSTSDGTTQIDHIFVSRYGIFVIETKNMRGWIFGSERQPRWTQKIYKKTVTFQNPLYQNYKHVKALQEFLNVPQDSIYSVVVFAGNSTFRSPMPAHVTQGGGYIRYIKSFDKPLLTEKQVLSVVLQIRSRCLKPTRETHKKHIKSLQKRWSMRRGSRP